MEWFRWFHGAVSDDKWPLIARRSGQNVAVVIAVWAALLECASQSEVRGCVEEFDPESMDAMLGLKNGSCQAVLNALSQGKRPRIENNRIVNWSKRQPQRERSPEGEKSTERVKKYRERQKELQAMSLNTNTNTSHETPCNGHETTAEHQKQPRTEQSREEENIYNNSTLSKELSISRAGVKGGVKNVICEAITSSSFSASKAGCLDTAGVKKFDVSKFNMDSAGIEFQELREFYSLYGRPEAPLAGFREYKQLRASGWPGVEAIYNSIQAYKLGDRQWNEGFAPGLARFLREGWWQKKPSAYKKGGEGCAKVKLKADEIIMRNAEVSRKILEAENGKFI